MLTNAVITIFNRFPNRASRSFSYPHVIKKPDSIQNRKAVWGIWIFKQMNTKSGFLMRNAGNGLPENVTLRSLQAQGDTGPYKTEIS